MPKQGLRMMKSPGTMSGGKTINIVDNRISILRFLNGKMAY